MKELYSKAANFLRDIDKDERVLIISHWDMDGVASGAIISRILREKRGKEADEFRIPQGRNHQIDQKTENLISKGKIDKLIITDINPGYQELKRILKNFKDKVLIIDHHNFEKVPEDVIFVNPRVEDSEVYTSASKLCYDIALKFGMDLAWIAGTGIIQDFNVKGSEAIFEKLKKEYPYYFPKKIGQENLAKNCKYGKLSKILNVKAYKDTAKYAQIAYKLLMKVNSLTEIENTEEYYELNEIYWDMIRELEKTIENYFDDRELNREKQVSFFKFSSEYHINSSIATNISLDEPQWVHIIVKESEDAMNISARCQSGRVNLEELLKKAMPDEALENGEAGGHRKAAGASLQKEYYKEFKENLIELI